VNDFYQDCQHQSDAEHEDQVRDDLGHVFPHGFPALDTVAATRFSAKARS
jgi:hypothetical protein